MKILLIGLHFSEYTYCLARELAKTNTVLLILNKKNAESELAGLKIENSDNFKITYLNHEKNISTAFRNMYEIIRQAKEFKPDIVHLQEVLHEYQTAAFIILRLLWPIILTVHDPRPHIGADAKLRSGFGKRRDFYSFIQRKLSSALITHGEFLCRQLIITNMGRQSVHSIHHGPLGLLFKRSSANYKANSFFTFLFFGRMQKYKGLDNFVEALKILQSQGMHVRAILAGKGPELSKIEASLRDNSYFILKNYYLSPHEVIDVFNEADVVVLPYTEGTQSGVAAYAIGVGKPCIVTQVGSLPEMVIDEETGIIIKPNDISDLITAMQRFYDDREMCKKMATAAKRLGENSLSWDNAAKKTLDVYQRFV